MISVKQQVTAFSAITEDKKNKSHPLGPPDVWYMNVDGMYCQQTLF